MSQKNRRGRPPHNDILTPAEWRVVHAVQHGMTSRQIASRRGISVDAVKFHISNVIAKLGLRDRKALRAWFRAPTSSALANALARRSTAAVNVPLKLGPIGQISRTVRDIQQSESWYRDVLGLPHLYTFGKMAFFDMGGTRLYLTQEAESHSQESILYLRVADMPFAYEALKNRGIEFISPPHMIHKHPDGTEEWMAFFKDPEARPLALMSQVKPGA